MKFRLVHPDQMADDLVHRRVGPKESFVYKVLFVISSGYTLLSSIGLLRGPELMLVIYEPDYLMQLAQLLGIIGLIVPLFWCYRINQLGDTKDFFYRFTALYIPISIVAGVVGVFVVLPGGLFGFFVRGTYGYTSLLLYGALFIFTTYLFTKYMRSVSTESKELSSRTPIIS